MENLGLREPGTAPDPRAYNCAPVGLCGLRLRGNERVSLWNLHPRHEMLEADLPGQAPRLLIQPPGCPVMELPAALQTVLIQPDEERVTVTWTGALRTAAPFPQEVCDSMRRAATWER